MASIEYVVNATDAASGVFAKIGLSADNLDRQLEDLSKRVATPEVDLEDTKFTLGLVRAAERLDKLSAKVADPKIEVDGNKAQLEILRINAMLDRLNEKRVSVSVDVDRSMMSRLGGLFGGGGGADGGGGGLLGLVRGIPGVAGAAPVSAQAVGIGGLGALAAALLPAILPVGIGGLFGGGAALGAFALGNKANKQLQALGKSLASAQSAQAAAASGRTRRAAGQRVQDIQGQMAALRKQYGPELAISGAFQDLGGVAKDVFAGSLKTAGPGFSGGGPGGTPGAPSFLTGLTGILKQVGGFVKSIGPQLGDMFRATIPFLQMFVKLLEQSAKILLPVFAQSLKQMTPYLPLISKGLLSIVQGLAGMIQALGPGGMKASAEIFVGLCKAMEFVLIGVGKAADWLAKAIMNTSHFIRVEWPHVVAAFRDAGKWITDHFDLWRHGWAHIWDDLFQFFIGRAIRGGHDIEREWNTWTHNTGAIFDRFRHDIASVWDAIWNNTIGRIIRGGHDVEARFDDIRARVYEIINHLPGQLWNVAKMAVENIARGAGSVITHVKSFFSGFAHDIVGIFKNIWGWFSPSAVMFQGGRSLMEGLEQGIKAHAHKAIAAAKFAAHRVADAGSGVQQWAGLVRQALGMEGLSPMLAGRVLYQMQTESGGNPNAINNWDSNAAAGDPSRGLLQVIGSTFAAYHWPGTSWNIYDPLANIAAAINYARHRYGPSLMSGGMGMGSGHGYATGSWSVPYTGPAVVHQGEMIIPAAAAAAVRAGAGRGNTYNINVNAAVGSNPKDIGRQIVGYIKSFEQGSGAGWRK